MHSSVPMAIIDSMLIPTRLLPVQAGRLQLHYTSYAEQVSLQWAFMELCLRSHKRSAC